MRALDTLILHYKELCKRGQSLITTDSRINPDAFRALLERLGKVEEEGFAEREVRPSGHH
jgi:hypothetical protein